MIDFKKSPIIGKVFKKSDNVLTGYIRLEMLRDIMNGVRPEDIDESDYEQLGIEPKKLSIIVSSYSKVQPFTFNVRVIVRDKFKTLEEKRKARLKETNDPNNPKKYRISF